MQPLKEKAWVNEQELANEHAYNNEKFKSTNDFKVFYAELVDVLSIDMNTLSDFILKNNLSFDQLKTFVEQDVENAFRLTDDQLLMLLTLGCTKALCDQPCINTWQVVTDIKHNSWEVENWLGFALEFYSKHEKKVSEIISLAKFTLASLYNGSLQPKSERFNGIVQNEIDSWEREKDPLKEIWFGLRGARDEFLPYLEYAPVFKIWFDADPESLIKELQKVNPYMAKSILVIAEVTIFNATFANWEKTIELTPSFFKIDGVCNKEVKSYLLPILLDAAYQEITQAKLETKDEDYVLALINNVVDVLAKRKDFSAIVMRWGNWLERVTLQDENDPGELSSSSFVASKILYHLGKKIKCKKINFITEPAEDFEGWEYWAHHSAMADHLYNDFLQEYKPDNFIEDWKLDLYSWGNEKAKKLLKKSFNFTHYDGNFPGKAAYQLVYPLTKAEKPYELWLGMWQQAHVLREIVQFGFKADVYGSAYKERNEASGLLILLFLTGLALLDLLVTTTTKKNNYAVKILLNELYDCLITMLYIDTTLNKKKWQSLYRHLAIRRYIWEDEVKSYFKENDEPQITNFIRHYKNDDFGLATLVENISINTQDKNKLKKYLSTCGVEIKSLIERVEILNLVDSRRYSLAMNELKLLVKTDDHNN